MKTGQFLFPLIALALLLAAGCAHQEPARPLTEKKPQLSEIPDSRYYYFMESQLHRLKGDTAKAVLYLTRAIALEPDVSFLKRELAVLHLIRKEYDQADAILARILEAHPDDVEALIMMGRMKELLKKEGGVKEIYEKVIASDPGKREVYLLLGRMYMDDSEFDSARKVYEKLVQNFSDSYAGYFFLGRINAQEGSLADAERYFKKTLRIEPSLTEPRFELLELYKPGKNSSITVIVKPGDSINEICYTLYQKYTDRIEAGILLLNPQLTDVNDITVGQKIRFPKLDLIRGRHEIIELYREILAVEPSSIRAKLELALYYHHEQMFPEAEALFSDLGQSVTTNDEILKKVIQLYIGEELYDEAIIVLTGMLRGAPDFSDLHYLAGVSYDGRKKRDQALSHLLKVRHGSKFHQRAAIHIAFMYQEDDDIDQAITFLEDALAKDPDNMDFMLFLGSFYEESGQLEKAMEMLQRGIGVDPESVKFHFRLGVIYDKTGDKGESIAQMKEVIRLDPDHANALNYLGYTYAEAGENLDEAEELIKKALRQKPGDGYITDSLGWVYYKMGQYEKAVELLEKAAGLVDDDPLVFEHLGDAYLKRGSRAQAIESYRRALEMRSGEADDGEALKQKIDALQVEEAPAAQ